jgi:hypothetical protein
MLSLSNRFINYIIIINRLGKSVIFEDFLNIKIETVIKRFIRCFYRYYRLLNAIVFNRKN